ncbi:MAG TPA: hypothetical protein VFE53_08560 [Mucilaginibacter sp.]|jgi:hypothetical protein|nr:hypothetical protein [Mucilaginibacter sp.]
MDEALGSEKERLKLISNSFYNTIIFSIFNYQRGPMRWEDNFFLKVTDDMVDTVSVIEMLIKKGFRNQCRRECRFALELAIKAAYINQQNPKSDFSAQIKGFQKLLKDPGITIVNQLNYSLFAGDQQLIDAFNTELKRMYGNLCNFIHVTPFQLKEKLEFAKTRTVTEELSLDEFKILNEEIGKVLSYIIVLLFNSIPEYIVGDFLEPAPLDFYFLKSKFIAKIDEQFDYKHEREARLEEARIARTQNIEF